MRRILFFSLFSPIIFSQNYSAKVYGFSIADAQLTLKPDSINLQFKTNGIVDFIWPSDNTYWTYFDSTHFGLKTFQKKIRQENFDQKCLIELNDGILKYKKETRVRGDSTKTIFTMFAMVTRRPYEMLDTQWFEMDHEGKPILGRFLWAGTETITIGHTNILCDHFRMDFKHIDETTGFLTQTDRFMQYAPNPDGVCQIWVERNGNRRIIRVIINAYGFPYEIVIKND